MGMSQNMGEFNMKALFVMVRQFCAWFMADYIFYSWDNNALKKHTHKGKFKKMVETKDSP